MQRSLVVSGFALLLVSTGLGASVSLGAGFFKVTHRGKPVDVKGWKWPLWSLYLDTPPR